GLGETDVPLLPAASAVSAVIGRLRQISSGGLRVVSFSRKGRFRSRREGFGSFSTPCGPITQLNGRRSVLTAFESRTRPSSQASGRGGHPGPYTSTGTMLSTP